MYGLLVLLGVLQVAAVALLIYYAGESFKREQSLLDRTAEMMEIALPGIKHDVLDVSRKASEIKGDISGLRTQVSQLDRHVGDVGKEVSVVGRKVSRLDENVTGFVQDKSGLIWGHSVNPYLLLVLLAVLLVSVPVCGYFFARRSSAGETQAGDRFPDATDAFGTKLDQLSLLLESIRHEQGQAEAVGPDIARLTQETERLISEARAELAQIALQPKPADQESDIAPDKLH